MRAECRTGVDCVIVAHNAGELLLEAVRSAVGEVGECRVWIMDAESVDGSLATVTAHFPDVNVVAVENRGFSASNNEGIERTSADWVLLLNPDAVLDEGAVARLVEAGSVDSRIAIVGPLVVDPAGCVQEQSFGRFPSLWERASIAIGRAWRRVTRSPVAAPDASVDVDWVTGACMLVRRSAIEEAGAMDEGFFLYYEDIEWCHRMRDSGLRVVLEPSARCVHHLGRSAAPAGLVARAYRESLYRYCDLYGLWGLKAMAAVAFFIRRTVGRAA